MVENGTIDIKDVELITFTDDLDKISKDIDKRLILYINNFKNYGLSDSEYYKKTIEQLQKQQKV